MTASMTGFARHTMTLPGYSMVWEIRSVNHRYLDLRVFLPEGLRQLESEVRKRLQQQLGRGRIEAQLSVITQKPDRPTAMLFDVNRVRALVATLKEIDQMMVNGARVSALEVLRWPGVLQQDPQEWDAEAIASIVAGLDASIVELRAIRHREGDELQRAIDVRLEQIANLIPDLRRRRHEIIAAQQQRLSARIAELGVDLEPQRLAQEIALLAQRLDIEEELDRLQGHIGAVHDALASAETAAGRRLDFLMQELNREANTLGAKSHDLATTQIVVEIKNLIEQMREQVQNIE